MKQDDALSDLSNILGELKEMAVDMGSEIERLVYLGSIIVNILFLLLGFLKKLIQFWILQA